jgi:hypothetical protein
MTTASINDGKMIHCNGCGFNVEPYDTRQETGGWKQDFTCESCKLCEAEPRLRECYRRGFNAGLDAMAKAVADVAQNSALRKWPR